MLRDEVKQCEDIAKVAAEAEFNKVRSMVSAISERVDSLENRIAEIKAIVGKLSSQKKSAKDE